MVLVTSNNKIKIQKNIDKYQAFCYDNCID